MTLFLSARLPAVVGMLPLDSMLSLIKMGRPNSGPRAVRVRSKARACASASGSTAITAWICGLSFSILVMAAAVSGCDSAAR